jgi:hypothetical protein
MNITIEFGTIGRALARPFVYLWDLIKKFFGGTAAVLGTAASATGSVAAKVGVGALPAAAAVGTFSLKAMLLDRIWNVVLLSARNPSVFVVYGCIAVAGFAWGHIDASRDCAAFKHSYDRTLARSNAETRAATLAKNEALNALTLSQVHEQTLKEAYDQAAARCVAKPTVKRR